MSECWALEKKEKRQKTDLLVAASGVKKSRSSPTEKNRDKSNFKPFISEGRVSLVGVDAYCSIKS